MAGNDGFLGADSNPGGDDAGPTWMDADDVGECAPPPIQGGCGNCGALGLVCLPLSILTYAGILLFRQRPNSSADIKRLTRYHDRIRGGGTRNL